MALLSTDIVTVALDPATWGLTWDGRGRLAMASGPAAVAQGMACRLKNVRSEWFADLDSGVPWFERPGVPPETAILGQRFDEPRVLAPMRAAILDTPGVTSISSLSVTVDAPTRRVRVTTVAITEFDDLAVTGDLVVGV